MNLIKTMLSQGIFIVCKEGIHFKYMFSFQVIDLLLLRTFYDAVFNTMKKLRFPYNLKRRGVRDKSSEGI